MKTIDAFNKINQINDERRGLQQQLNQLETDELVVRELCPHEIVFKYTDNHPRKMNIDGTYYCPACGKTISAVNKVDIKDSAFKKSRIIPLTNLSLLGTQEVHNTIKEEVLKNLEEYYDPVVPVEELSYIMESLLKDKQSDFLQKDKVFKKSN